MTSSLFRTDIGILDAVRAQPAIWWIFGLALTVRLLLLASLHDSFYTVGMAQGELARNLSEGRGFVINPELSDEMGRLQNEQRKLVDVEDGLTHFLPDDRPENIRPFIAYMMPGQGILLAGTYLLFGEYRYIYLQTFQAIADSFGVFLIFWLGCVFMGRKAGMVSAILFAVYIPEARLAITATRDAWMPLIYTASAWALTTAWRNGSTRNYFFFGLLVAAGAYFRSEILLLPLFAFILRFLFEKDLKSLLKPAFAVFGAILLLLLPWTVRNAVVLDRFIPTNSGLWLAVWQSFGEYENSFGAVHDDTVTFRQTRQWGYTAEFHSPEYDDIFKSRVLGVVWEHPGWLAWTFVRRLARIPFQMHSWGVPETDEMMTGGTVYPAGRVDLGSYWRYVTAEPVRFVIHAGARLINASLYAGVFIWFLLPGRERRRDGLILLIIPLYNILIHTLLGVHARYIVPTNGILLIFASATLTAWIDSRFLQTEAR